MLFPCSEFNSIVRNETGWADNLQGVRVVRWVVIKQKTGVIFIDEYLCNNVPFMLPFEKTHMDC